MTYPHSDTITVQGTVLDIAVCPHGCRIYPASSLSMHMAAHDRMDRLAVGTYGWSDHRVPNRHRGNKNGRPKKKESEKRWPAGVNVRLK